MEYYDLGSYTRKVTTAVPDAQLWFDRGSPIPPAVQIVGPSRARGEGTMSGMAQGATGEGIAYDLRTGGPSRVSPVPARGF